MRRFVVLSKNICKEKNKIIAELETKLAINVQKNNTQDVDKHIKDTLFQNKELEAKILQMNQEILIKNLK